MREYKFSVYILPEFHGPLMSVPVEKLGIWVGQTQADAIMEASRGLMTRQHSRPVQLFLMYGGRKVIFSTETPSGSVYVVAVESARNKVTV